MINILIVEDDASFARFITLLFESDEEREYNVFHVQSLKEATETLSDDYFDAILLDLGLTDSEGLNTLDKISAIDPSAAIVVLSGLDNETVALQSVNHGAQDYLIKGQFDALQVRRSVLYAIERKKVFSGLGESGDLFEAVLGSTRDAVMAFSPEVAEDEETKSFETYYRFAFANAATEVLFALPARELGGRNLGEFISREENKELYAILEKVSTTGVEAEDEINIQISGWDKWLNINVFKVKDYIAVNASDITMRKKYVEALKEAKQLAEDENNAKLQVLSAISHEMRTPLNNILGFAEMIEGEVFGPLPHEQYKDYVSDIYVSARSLAHIVNNLLDRPHFEELQKTQGSYRSLIDLAPDLICILERDKIRQMNPAGAQLLGVWPAETLVGRSFVNFVHDDYKPIVADGFLDLTSENERIPMKLISSNDELVDVEVAAVPCNYKDYENAVMLVARDVTERKKAMQKVREREQRLARIMETVADAIILVDDNCKVENFNQAALDTFGHTHSEMIGLSVDVLLDSDEDNTAYIYFCPIDGEGSDKTTTYVAKSFSAKRKDGLIFPIEVSRSNMVVAGRSISVLAVRDVTKRKRNEERLEFLATRDPLTATANRTHFRERFSQCMAGIKGKTEKAAALFVDLVRFRAIVEIHGNHVGEMMLKEAARRIVSACPDNAIVARLSGDEFIVLIDRIKNREEASDLASNIIGEFQAPAYFGERKIVLDPTIGVVICPDEARNFDQLLKNLDTALLATRENRTKRVSFYDASMGSRQERRTRIETELRRALENDEFHLVFQPRVDLTTGQVVGAETLLRWKNATLGLVSPGEFIPIAESIGMILPIGDWVFENTCIQIAKWRKKNIDVGRISVNLSGRQFMDTELTQKIKNAMEHAGVLSDNIELELTESALIANPDKARETLFRLRDMGLTIAIDDFGTGYSSFGYLKRFPINSLKIDRTFVCDLPGDHDDSAIAKGIIGLGQSLGMRLVAEGIETGEQLGFLMQNSCEEGQGYLLSYPLPPEDVEPLLGQIVSLKH